jgi:hypothetical protein
MKNRESSVIYLLAAAMLDWTLFSTLSLIIA